MEWLGEKTQMTPVVGKVKTDGMISRWLGSRGGPPPSTQLQSWLVSEPANRALELYWSRGDNGTYCSPFNRCGRDGRGRRLLIPTATDTPSPHVAEKNKETKKKNIEWVGRQGSLSRWESRYFQQQKSQRRGHIDELILKPLFSTKEREQESVSGVAIPSLYFLSGNCSSSFGKSSQLCIVYGRSWGSKARLT